MEVLVPIQIGNLQESYFLDGFSFKVLGNLECEDDNDGLHFYCFVLSLKTAICHTETMFSTKSNMIW